MSEENNDQVVENIESAPAMLAPEESVIAPVEEPVAVPEPVFEPAPHIIEEAPAPMPENNVITAPSHPASEIPAVGIVENGVIGSTVRSNEAATPVSFANNLSGETVAIYSTRNVNWSEVGKVYFGYNIVSKAAAEKWLTRKHIRLATPEEVAREFGK